MDEDQSARRVAQKWLRKVDPNYYEFESEYICHTQCGNFRIFLSLRFYVKSTFGESRSTKSGI